MCSPVRISVLNSRVFLTPSLDRLLSQSIPKNPIIKTKINKNNLLKVVNLPDTKEISTTSGENEITYTLKNLRITPKLFSLLT
jgi:hypothetical protein